MESSIRVLKGELVLDRVQQTRHRIIYLSPDLTQGFWIKVDPASNIPEPINLADIAMKLETRTYETVVDSTCLEAEENISKARIAERDRIYGIIKDLVNAEPAIYNPHERAAILREHESKTGIGLCKLYDYLGKFWRGGMTINSLLPRYNKRGPAPGSEPTLTRRTGKHKRDGMNGKILTKEDRNNFETAIKEHYSSDTRPSLRDTYDWMLAKMYVKPRFKNDTEPEPLSPDEKPSYNQFYYWHLKNKNPVSEQKSRLGNKYDTTSRGAAGSSDTNVKGPGMVVQIDATIADYYLVREHHRNEVVGRPVMFFIKDVKTRMIMGMYVTLENTSWNCALMALKNTAEDKVEFCKRYGVDIKPEEWPCYHLPVSITADNGEMGDKGVEEIIAKLGITVENTPPYRGDLKGIIEKNFEMIDLRLRYIVPGHVDKDDGQRGAINRRKESCIDIRTFIQMIIRCVLYYNNYHYLETYTKTPEMRKAGIRPIPREMWNYGMQFQSGLLRIIPKEDIYRILLPKDKAVVTCSGILFRDLYYTCEKARKELWFDKAKIGGRWSIPITYDPSCLNRIYITADDGSMAECELLTRSSIYEDSSEDDMVSFKEQDRQEQATWAQNEEKARTRLILELEVLAQRCNKEKKAEGMETVGNVLNKHRLRSQREAEKAEQSGETAAREEQKSQELEQSEAMAQTGRTQDIADSGVNKDKNQTTYSTAKEAMDQAIDKALREAGILE